MSKDRIITALDRQSTTYCRVCGAWPAPIREPGKKGGMCEKCRDDRRTA
jgi:hypothetical protein